MKNPILLNNSDLLKLSREFLKRGTSIRFRAKGFSMRPFIQDGDLITVGPLRNPPVKVGDVVLYKTAGDRAIVHRVIRKTRIDGGTVFFIKGDATFGQPEKVNAERVLGRVTAIKRNGLKRRLDTKLSIPELNRQLEKEAQENSRRRIIFLKDVKLMQDQNKTTLINGHDFPDVYPFLPMP